MNNNLGKVSLTGDPHNDFSTEMIINHFAGIEISQVALKNSSDSLFKEMARKKILYLNKQDEYFDSYQFNHNVQYSPAIKKKASLQKHRSIPAYASKDLVFASVLSEYNENTIEMSKDYLKKGRIKK